MIMQSSFEKESIKKKKYIMGILYEDSGCVDVYCTMGVEVDAHTF